MTASDLTIVICARDAAATLPRALASCLAERECPILVIDDHSADTTGECARGAAPGRVRLLAAPDPGGLAMARQAALDVVNTPLAAWLDADDEWVPGRAARLAEALTRADVASDPIDLHDGADGRRLRHIGIPAFLRRRPVPALLFERNYLPGDSQAAFRVDLLRALGYDPATSGVESYDILLRALSAGARFAYLDETGYRMYHYASSMSRDRGRQRARVAAVLAKHEYEAVRALCVQAGESERAAAWVLVAMAVFRGELEAALRYIDEAAPPSSDPGEVLEADGPLPVPEGWRRDFCRGTCLLLGAREEEAEAHLQAAEARLPTAEGANNLGVALARLGRVAEAHACWAAAAVRFPGFADARANLAGAGVHVTPLPLRRYESRSDYA